jgi:hypothetical protein
MAFSCMYNTRSCCAILYADECYSYLICLTIAPVFISAAIYLCLTRIIGLYGSHLARFKPRTIAIAFMSSDFLSLVLQAIGGAM